MSSDELIFTYRPQRHRNRARWFRLSINLHGKEVPWPIPSVQPRASARNTLNISRIDRFPAALFARVCREEKQEVGGGKQPATKYTMPSRNGEEKKKLVLHVARLRRPQLRFKCRTIETYVSTNTLFALAQFPLFVGVSFSSDQDRGCFLCICGASVCVFVCVCVWDS